MPLNASARAFIRIKHIKNIILGFFTNSCLVLDKYLNKLQLHFLFPLRILISFIRCNTQSRIAPYVDNISHKEGMMAVLIA